jgi:phospholipase/carboxylesterase
MLKHLIKYPSSNINKTKALFMLHGFGSNETDLFSFTNVLPGNLMIISIRAPYKLEYGGYAWYDIQIDSKGLKHSNNFQAEDSLYQINNFIDNITTQYKIDTQNINLMGFSQGAILSYALSFWHPEKFKNIIALSGYINRNIMPVDFSFEKYKDLNYFISHGTYDDIIPVEKAREILPYLDERNIKYTYNEYSMGHEVNKACMNDMLKWINQNL